MVGSDVFYELSDALDELVVYGYASIVFTWHVHSPLYFTRAVQVKNNLRIIHSSKTKTDRQNTEIYLRLTNA